MAGPLKLSAVLLAACLATGCSRPPAPRLSAYDRIAKVEARDRAAEAELERLGARVEPTREGTAVVLHDADTPTADAAVAAAGRLMDLSSLSLVASQPSAGWVSRLSAARHLRHLTLSGVRLWPQDIAAIGALPGLDSLHLIDTEASDAQIAYLVEHCPRLRELTIARADVTDRGGLWLVGLERLRRLRLVETRIGGRRITHLVIENPWLVVEMGDEGEVKGGWAFR